MVGDVHGDAVILGGECLKGEDEERGGRGEESERSKMRGDRDAGEEGGADGLWMGEDARGQSGGGVGEAWDCGECAGAGVDRYGADAASRAICLDRAAKIISSRPFLAQMILSVRCI